MTIHGILEPTSGALKQSKTFFVNKAGSKSIRPDLSKPQISVLRGSRSAPFKDALAASWASVQTKFQSARHVFDDCILILLLFLAKA